MAFQTVTRNKRLWPAVEAGGCGNPGFALLFSLKLKVSYWPKVWRIFFRGGFLPFPQQPSWHFFSSPFLQHFFPSLAPTGEGGRVGGFKTPPENDGPGSCLLTTVFSVSSAVKLGWHTCLRGLLQNQHTWMSGPIHCRTKENKRDSSPARGGNGTEL